MNQDKTKSFHEATESDQNADASASDRIGGHQEQCSDLASGTEAPPSDQGAPSSNTAPQKYIPYYLETHILRTRVDSLYVSYRGTLDTTWEAVLEELKKAAGSIDETDQATAQIKIGKHLLSVSGYGRKKYAFVISNNCFQIQLARHTATKMPMAYVQISSEILTALSVQGTMKELNFIINSLGLVKDKPLVSRVDLCADFITDYPLHEIPEDVWVCRSHKRDRHQDKVFTGWSFALGSILSGRLYDKTTEIKKTHKDFLKPLWVEAGWNGKQTVWRLEFQLKREVLVQFGVKLVDDLFEHNSSLWHYCTTKWLRLTIPNVSDKNRTRWPNHPMWSELQTVQFDSQTPSPLTRLRIEQLPSDEALFINGFGAITSFMASRGITELDEGFGEYFAHAEKYINNRGRKDNMTFRKYINQKVKFKGRKFNTLDNRIKPKSTKPKEKAYKKARDGEL